VKRCAGLHTVCGHRRRLVVSKVWTRQCDRSFHANGKLSDACRIQWNDHKRKEGDMLHKHAGADIICCGIMPVSVLVHNLHQNGTGRSCPCVERQPETILHRERLVDESEERESRGSVPVADDQVFQVFVMAMSDEWRTPLLPREKNYGSIFTTGRWPRMLVIYTAARFITEYICSISR
jgi:hypothetical protein